MIFNPEFRAALRQAYQPKQRSLKPRPREIRLEARPEESGDISVGEVPDDVTDSDDRSQADIAVTIDITFEVPLALPPPQPSWSFLCDRAGASVSVLLARSVLESVGCYLGIHPPATTLLAVARCRSVGAIRQLLRACYGERGLDAAYQLAGILQPPQSAESFPNSKASQSVKTAERFMSLQGFTSQARITRWFERQEPVPPPWRSSVPPAGSDDGSWVGY